MQMKKLIIEKDQCLRRVNMDKIQNYLIFLKTNRYLLKVNLYYEKIFS